MMERIALSHPDISFKFINNGQIRLHTSGNSRLKDIIYHIYGRDIAANLLEINGEFEGFSVSGFIGKPVVSRSNRNFESYFINGRYIKSKLIAKAIEDGYHGFLMQHKYPFTVLLISVDGKLVDVNVHPNKMELRFSDGEQLYRSLFHLIHSTLKNRELIADVGLESGKKEQAKPVYDKNQIPEPFEKNRLKQLREEQENKREDNTVSGSIQSVPETPVQRETTAGQSVREPLRYGDSGTQGQNKVPLRQQTKQIQGGNPAGQEASQQPKQAQQNKSEHQSKLATQIDSEQQSRPVQQTMADYDLPETRLLSEEAKPKHHIIGQLFDTYWLVEFQDRFYMIDQRAAHEKILFEQMMRRYREKKFTSQMISPPILLSLSMQEETLLRKYKTEFEKLGFVIEPFGGKEYMVSAVPADLYGLNAQNLLLELIDDLSSVSEKDTPEMVLEKIAGMSCKAAVKGNNRLSHAEAEQLITDLLKLENPYFCPHGRPVIVSMTKYEIEKKFKRIV